jgi:type I site-specific restriction-modification system R (restriction) subunit
MLAYVQSVGWTVVSREADEPAVLLTIDRNELENQRLKNLAAFGLPNATYLGFTGTPVDKTVYGKGTFQDLRLRGRPGLLAQVFHCRQHRGRHPL